MPSKEKTSVVLTELSQRLKNELTPIYGLKNTLSAGVWLFHKLSTEHREQVIKIVAGIGESDIDLAKSAVETLKSATHIRILSPKEQELLQQLRRALGPENSESQTKRKAGS